jgi:hypothetical protein
MTAAKAGHDGRKLSESGRSNKPNLNSRFRSGSAHQRQSPAIDTRTIRINAKERQMTRTITNTIASALVATVVGASAPALAGGSFSFNYQPQNARDAQMLQTGLAFYGLYNHLQKGGSIKQRGYNNSAGLGQYGSGNYGVIHQEGNGHQATLNQYGNNNSYGIFQFGRNTSANVGQYGNGQSGATFQFGW